MSRSGAHSSESLCSFPVEEALKQDTAHDEKQRDDGAAVDSFTQKERGDDRGEEGGEIFSFNP